MKGFRNLVCPWLISVFILVGCFPHRNKSNCRFLLVHPFAAVYHLEYLGMQVAWISGPWFLSIFVNVLPWESGKVLVLCINFSSNVTVHVLVKNYLITLLPMGYFTSSSPSLGCASL